MRRAKKAFDAWLLLMWPNNDMGVHKDPEDTDIVVYFVKSGRKRFYILPEKHDDKNFNDCNNIQQVRDRDSTGPRGPERDALCLA